MRRVLPTLLLLSLFGFGCVNDVPTLKEKDSEKELRENAQLNVAQKEMTQNVKIRPIEFSCSNKICLITEVARKWAGMDPSNSTCIWTIVGGSAQIPIHEVTSRGIHQVESYSADSILCQNETGEIFFGNSETKVVPTGTN